MDIEKNISHGPEIFLEGEELESAPVEEIGGKAFNLVRLKTLQEKYGFVVPEFFVIPTSFWKSVYEEVGFEERAEEIMARYATAGDIMRQNRFNMHYSREVPDEIESIYRKEVSPRLYDVHESLWDRFRLGSWKPEYFYIRSSSPLEDSSKDSFAGVFLSRDCPGSVGGLVDNLQDVLLSPWTAHAEYYFRKRELNGEGLRTLGILIQAVPNNRQRQYNGQIFIEPKGVELEYTQIFRPFSYMYNKAIFDKRLNLIEHDEVPKPARPTEFMPEGRLRDLVLLFSNIADEFPEFSEGCNFEFSLRMDGVPYLFQARETTLARAPVFTELADIPEEKIRLRVRKHHDAFTPGKYSGVIVNFLDTKDKDLPLERLSQMDEQYPGAIYVTRLHHGYPEIGETYDFVSSFAERHNIATPNKTGVVICTPKLYRHSHFIDAMRNSGFLIFGTIEDFRNLPTGLNVGVISSTEDAVIYEV